MDQYADLWGRCLRFAAKSDVGLRRANNQDSMDVVLAAGQQAWQQHGHLFVVADGMGAHAAGELASKIATDVVPLSYHKLSNLSPPEALVNAIWDANKQIHTRGQASPDFKGMGTTCSVLAILPFGALVAHVGDSRVYRVRGTRIDQLTFDHSLVWEIRRSGQIPDEAAANLVGKNIITRSLGPHPTVEPDLEGPFPIEIGDLFLLCSDGLSGQVTDDEIGLVLRTLPPDEAVETLVHLGNLRGGPDNITIVVAQVTGPQVCQGEIESPPVKPPPAPSHVHPAVWVWLGVSLLAGVVFLMVAQFLPAMIAFGSTVLAAMVTLLQHFASSGRGWIDGRPLGRGPHVSSDCSPTPDRVARFAAILNELRTAAGGDQWQVDVKPVDASIERARAATAAGDHARAAQEYLRSIRLLMDQLKHQRKTTSDSSIFG